MVGQRHAAELTVEAIKKPRPSLLARAVAFSRQKPLGAISAVIIVLFILGAVLAPLITPYDPLKTNLPQLLKSPSWRHPFGTDELGRDLLTRIIYGGRVSLYVGFLSVLIGTTIGAVLGLVSGYWQGTADMLIQRVIDTIMAFPSLILALALTSILHRSTNSTLVVIGIVIIPSAARVVRGATMTAKQNVYVEAARAIGCSNLRVLVRHILPNVVAPIIVVASVFLGSAIIVEASLSFLGVGVPPPTPSWGSMLSGPGRSKLEVAPWLMLFPALALSAAIFAFNLLGDALRDVLDPRLRGGGKIRS